MLADALARAGQAAGGTAEAAELVGKARVSVERTAGRYRSWMQRELFSEADSRVRELRAEVCQLARDLGTAVGAPGEARRKRARKTLTTVIRVLPMLILAIGGVSPSQLEANLSAWGHDAVRVITTYLVAEQAQPEVLIEPPELSGPELSL